MGACPKCGLPVEHLEFVSQTGKFRLTGIFKKDGDAVINFARELKNKELGFHCPVCGELLTEDVLTARRILMENAQP